MGRLDHEQPVASQARPLATPRRRYGLGARVLFGLPTPTRPDFARRVFDRVTESRGQENNEQ